MAARMTKRAAAAPPAPTAGLAHAETPFEGEIVENGFYALADGSTVIVAKLLATAVRYVVLGAEVAQKSKDVTAGKKTLAQSTITLKQFRAAVVGVADIPLPQVGEYYRQPRDSYFDEYALDAVRVVGVDGGDIEYVQVERYEDRNEHRRPITAPLAKFLVEHSERVYIPTRFPQIVEGGVYRDHGGAILRVLRMKFPDGKGRHGRENEMLAVFTVNGGAYEYCETPYVLRPAIAATLDPNALTNESLAEADYAVQVSAALGNLKTANEALAEADEAKKASAAALAQAKVAHKKALMNLNALSTGQPMLPGVHAAILAGEQIAEQHERDVEHSDDD